MVMPKHLLRCGLLLVFALALAAPLSAQTEKPSGSPAASEGAEAPPPSAFEEDLPPTPMEGRPGPDSQDAAEPEAGQAEPEAEAEPFDFDRMIDETVEKVPWLQGGFLDVRAGTRVIDDPYHNHLSLAEARLQLDFEHWFDDGTGVTIRPDFLYDPVPGRDAFDLERGTGWLDLREANILFVPTDWMDVKVGRQILTWGTGDLLFLNDLFPKDWKSFFIGRDVEYLKAPSDAVKVSLFHDLVNFDVVYTPRMDADRYIDGDRISYFNRAQGRRSGTYVHTERRDDWFDDSETAWRFSRTIEGYEAAVYGYHGFWKSPEGFNPATGEATFPRLSVYGASVRGPVAGGIGNAEIAGYDSRQDHSGRNPFVPNSELRYLVGYSREIAQELTLGLQYYLEQMLDYSAYKRALPAGLRREDRVRQVLTLRLTKLAMNQNLTLSMFAFYSPTESDCYLRPHVAWKVSDAWTVEAGANVWLGAGRQTFFAQFEKNTNIYAGARYSF